MSRQVTPYLDWLDRLASDEENDPRQERADRSSLPYREKIPHRRSATTHEQGRRRRNAVERHGDDRD